MTLVEQLNKLQREIPGCQAVVFGDIETGTVLRVCAGEELRQEDHDALLVRAAACLGPAAAALSELVFGKSADSALLCQAVLLSSGNASLFQRSAESPADVTCISVDVSTPVSVILKALSDLCPLDD